jgi:hypothetical protein
MNLTLPPIPIGADWVLPVYWKDEDGVDINATGYTARMQIRETVNSSTVLATLTTADGTIVAGTNPAFLLSILRATTGALTPVECAVWDLMITNTLGVMVRFLHGKISIVEPVTR